MAKRRHHYVPVFYLNGFTSTKQKLFVYEKGNAEIKAISPRDAAVIKDYYSFTLEEGTKDSETIENFFSELETKTAPIIQKIHTRNELSDEDRGWFAAFIAATMLRVPNFRSNVENAHSEIIKIDIKGLASDKSAWEESYRQLEREADMKSDISAEELRQFALDEGRYKVNTNQEFSLPIALEMIPEIADLFLKMNWSFCEATRDLKFITSDNPVYYFDPTLNPRSLYGKGLIDKNIEVTFPLSSEFALLATWGKCLNGYIKTNNKIVKKVNHCTILSSKRYVFAHYESKPLNRCAQKYVGSAPVFKVK